MAPGAGRFEWCGGRGGRKVEPMNGGWKSRILGGALAMAAAAVASGQVPEPPKDSSGPLLTLGTPALRSSLERLSLAWLYPSQIPDVRLKVDRPTLEQLSTLEADTRLRGVEFRLPLRDLWVGYETPAEGDLPRATLSIQRGF